MSSYLTPTHAPLQDMVAIEGHRMCNGQHPSTCQLQQHDDPIVQRFRDIGAIILGEGRRDGERETMHFLLADLNNPLCCAVLRRLHHHDGGRGDSSGLLCALPGTLLSLQPLPLQRRELQCKSSSAQLSACQ